MKLRDIMTPHPHTIGPNESVKRAAAIMRDENVGMLTVVENEQIVGVITDRDIALRSTADECIPRYAIAQVMTRDVVSIEQEAELDDAIGRMKQRGVRRLIVTDNGRLAGILSADDIAATMPGDPRATDLTRALADIYGRSGVTG